MTYSDRLKIKKGFKEEITLKTLYLECNMGAAGDMLMAAMYELISDKQVFLDKMNHLWLPNVTIIAEPAVKCGITGTYISVRIEGEEEGIHPHSHHPHHHAGLENITHILSYLDISESVRNNACEVYQLIAEAESYAHGKPVEQIHFHEVGTLDAVADIVGVCILMEMLAPDQVIVSPVCTGFGQVQCAHGILPVPAPATAYILRGIPTYSGAIRGELCTPTGAALLKHFANRFESQPVMCVEQIGYGMGKKEFEAANCVRAMIGGMESKSEQIIELRCNLDDMTPEEISFAQERLFAGGALDVFTVAVGMKKNRSGILLAVLCKPEKREQMVRLLFQHTTTLGVRQTVCQRDLLSRAEFPVQTQYGTVQVKQSEGWGVCRKKVEYEDLSRIAQEQGLDIRTVRRAIEKGI